MISDLLIIRILLTSLVCTIIIEVLVAYLLKIRDKKDLLNVVLVNMLTNPVVVLTSLIINLKYGLLYRNISLIFLELFAFLVEGFIYKRVLNFKKINPYLISLILNVTSYVIGTLINFIIY